MPRVGKKHFAYTEKGHKQAMDEAHRTGKPMSMGGKGPMKKAMKKGMKR